jgi:hypothetical protein
VPAAGVPSPQIEASLALIHDFRRVSDVAALTRSLHVPGGL